MMRMTLVPPLLSSWGPHPETRADAPSRVAPAAPAPVALRNCLRVKVLRNMLCNSKR
jgi:hypothetical protein